MPYTTIGDLYDIHPGSVLKFDYLEPLEITTYRLAKSLDIGQTHLADILEGKRNITANIALRLARAFDTTPEFWLNLQNRYDVERAKLEQGEKYKQIETLPGIDLLASRSA